MSAVNVYSSTQRVEVNAPNDEISVILTGPQGPAGTPGVGSGGTGIPTGGTVNQVLVKNSSTNGDASWKNLPGFTYVTDVMPTPVRAGETWFDSSDSTSGGSSWVAIDENPAGGGEKVWVQFSAPGASKLLATGYFTAGFTFAVSPFKPLTFSSNYTNVPSAVSFNNGGGIITVLRAGNYRVSVSYGTNVNPTTSGSYYHNVLVANGNTIGESIENTGQPYGTVNINAVVYNLTANSTIWTQSAMGTAAATASVRSPGQISVEEL